MQKARWFAFALALLACAVPAAAQDGALATQCQAVPAGEARNICLAVAQAAESAQPQIGILLAGGNPVLGSAGPGGGIRLPGLPNVDLTARASVVFVRLPDILADQVSVLPGQVTRRLGVPAPALAFGGSVGIFPGVGVVPGFGGIGSVDLLVNGAWLPFRAFRTDGFDTESPDIAWGVGARIGLLRESFVAPAVSVSVMRRGLGNVAFGNVCRGEEVGFPLEPNEFECMGPNGSDPGGDAGEFAFDLVNWSTRAVVGKRLLGVGLAGGIGYDRYSSEVGWAVRYPREFVDPPSSAILRPPAVDVRDSRWSAFGNLSYQFLMASLALEAGWQQGGSAVPGFQGGQFDPRGGSFFGSAGVRVAF